MNNLCHPVNEAAATHANSKMSKIVIKAKSHLALFATKIIKPEDEINYDYWDNARNLWWRQKVLLVLLGHSLGGHE